MLLIHGRRTLRTKLFKVNDHQCSDCKDFDMNVKVYEEYYHVCYIPFLPLGNKTAKIRCAKCDEPFRVEAVAKKYAKETKSPFYLYAGPLLIVLTILTIFSAFLLDRYQTSDYVAHPKKGDIYLLQTREPILSTYSFLRVKEINGDTVVAYHSELRYFHQVLRFAPNDFFNATQTSAYTKDELVAMLKRGLIKDAHREYNDDSGFDRIK